MLAPHRAMLWCEVSWTRIDERGLYVLGANFKRGKEPSVLDHWTIAACCFQDKLMRGKNSHAKYYIIFCILNARYAWLP